MSVDPSIVQQNARTGTQGADVPPPANPPSPNELRDQIREQMRAVQEATRDLQREAEREAQREANQVRIQNGVPVRPGRPNGPGSTIQVEGMPNMIPPQVVDIAQGFFFMIAAMVIGWPLARAFGRRLERGAQTAGLPPVMGEQLQRIERAVESMSIEVERISEAQRYMAKLQNVNVEERAALPGTDRR